MSPIEREEFINRMKGMSPEEMILAAECLPTDVIYRELGMRLLTQKGFVEKISHVTESFRERGVYDELRD